MPAGGEFCYQLGRDSYLYSVGIGEELDPQPAGRGDLLWGGEAFFGFGAEAQPFATGSPYHAALFGNLFLQVKDGRALPVRPCGHARTPGGA